MNLAAARLVILSYAILIAYLSLSSGELQDWGNIAYLDKMQHAMAYSGFAFLGCFCVWRWRLVYYYLVLPSNGYKGMLEDKPLG